MIFNVTIDRDEDGIWIVECPSIPGCKSQGDTKAEGLKNIKAQYNFVLSSRRKRLSADN